MFAKALALIGLAASSLALTITGPGPNAFWVQNVSNEITWTFNAGDPNPIDITITNPNSSFLNGAFSIMRSVDSTNGSFIVTNVTLRVDTGYIVNFVNDTNQSQIFASSQPFDVKAPGTPPASLTSSPTGTAAGSLASATSPANSSASSSASSATTAPSSGALSMRMGEGRFRIVPMLAMTGLMTFLGAAITL